MSKLHSAFFPVELLDGKNYSWSFRIYLECFFQNTQSFVRVFDFKPNVFSKHEVEIRRGIYLDSLLKNRSLLLQSSVFNLKLEVVHPHFFVFEYYLGAEIQNSPGRLYALFYL